MPKSDYHQHLASRAWGLKRRVVTKKMRTIGIIDAILHQHGLLGEGLTGLRQALEGELPNVLSEVLIQADPSQDTYALIRSKLGPTSLECPDLWPSNHPGSRHITQLSGGPTGTFFRFSIHPQDGDKASASGRPRNEIKGDGNSPDEANCFHSDIMRFHWYFRISASYSKGGNVDSEHILHQLHSTASGPIIKFEMRRGQLSVSHYRDNTNQNEINLASTEVAPLLGQWLEAEEIIHFDRSGYYQVTVRNEAGIVLQAERSGLDMWSGGFTRPKWGIYRGRGSGYRSEDFVDFARITIQKLEELPSPGKPSLVWQPYPPKTQQNFRESRQARERYEQSLPGPRHPRE